MEDVSLAAKDLLRYIQSISQEKFQHFRDTTATSLSKYSEGDPTSAFLEMAAKAKDLLHNISAVSQEKAVSFWNFSTPLLVRYYEIGLLHLKQIAKSPTVNLLVEKSGVILSSKGIMAICFGWLALKVLGWWFSGGGGGGSKMMKAPGRHGVRIPREQFAGNPKGYFRKLRSS